MSNVLRSNEISNWLPNNVLDINSKLQPVLQNICNRIRTAAAQVINFVTTKGVRKERRMQAKSNAIKKMFIIAAGFYFSGCAPRQLTTEESGFMADRLDLIGELLPFAQAWNGSSTVTLTDLDLEPIVDNSTYWPGALDDIYHSSVARFNRGDFYASAAGDPEFSHGSPMLFRNNETLIINSDWLTQILRAMTYRDNLECSEGIDEDDCSGLNCFPLIESRADEISDTFDLEHSNLGVSQHEEGHTGEEHHDHNSRQRDLGATVTVLNPEYIDLSIYDPQFTIGYPYALTAAFFVTENTTLAEAVTRINLGITSANTEIDNLTFATGADMENRIEAYVEAIELPTEAYGLSGDQVEDMMLEHLLNILWSLRSETISWIDDNCR